MLINDQEKEIAKKCIGYAKNAGADGIRISLDKSILDSYAVRDGETDKVMHSADCGLSATIFKGGSCGSFSTNMLNSDSLERFIKDAVSRTSLLGKDRFKRLPDHERLCKNAVTGLEMGLYDDSYHDICNDTRKFVAFEEYGKVETKDLVSCETEYSDSLDDSYLIDSQGLECRHIETGFSIFVQTTIQDRNGNRFSGSWWDSTSKRSEITSGVCAEKAYMKAVGQIGAKKHRSGKFKMVVDSRAASAFTAPIIRALYGSYIQQGTSFLAGKIGKQVFPDNVSIIDKAVERGKLGARLFDNEGVATSTLPLIENGVISNYVLDTYSSGKLGMQGTVDDVSRPTLLQIGENALTLKDIVRLCGDGILVTGTNGGNSNPVTGDFSYGVEGFSFHNGEICSPIREMVVTGNIVELWGRVIAAGDDALRSLRWQFPTIAFDDAVFSA